MKKLFIILIFFTLTVGLNAKEVSIMLSPFITSESVSKSKSNLSLELIRVAMINSQSINIIDNPTSFKSNKNNITAYEKKILVTAKERKIDFVLVGSLRDNTTGSYMLTVKLINVVMNKEVIGESYPLSTKMRGSEHEKIAVEIINAIKSYSEVTIGDIKTYVSSKDWSNVVKYVEMFRANPKNLNNSKTKNEVSRFYKRAILKLSNQHYTVAVKYLKEYRFGKARDSVRRAIKLLPRNRKYKKFLLVIKNSARSYKKNIAKSMLKTVKNLIDDGNYRSAYDIIERLESNGSKNRLISKYKKIIDKELKAISHYKKAKKHYSNENYKTAHSQIKKAIRLKRKEKKYKDFKAQILQKKKQQEIDDKRFKKYYSFIPDISLFGLFGDKKQLSNYEGIGYFSTDFIHIDEQLYSSFGDNLHDNDKLSGVELSIFWNIPMPYIDINNDTFDFHLTTIGTLGYSSQYRESKSSLNFQTSIMTEKITNIDFTATFGPTVKFMSFYFGLGLSLDIGYIAGSSENSVLFANNETSKSDYSYSKFTTGTSVWIGWLPTNNIHVYYHWKEYSMELESGNQSNGPSSFSNSTIGVGYKFF